VIKYRVLYKRVAGRVYAQKLEDGVVVEMHELGLLLSSWRKMAQQFMRHPGEAERLAFEWVKRVSGGGDSSALGGEAKEAIWHKKYHQLTYWTSHNTTATVDCASLARAKKIVENSSVEQELKTTSSDLGEGIPWPKKVGSYEEVRKEAQSVADQSGLDVGVEYNKR